MYTYVCKYVCMYVFFFIEVGAVTYLVENGWWFCGRNELGKWTHAPPHLSLLVGFDLGFWFRLLLFFCVCFLLRFLVLDSVRHYVEQVARDYWFSAKRVAPYVANATATLLQLASTMQPRWNWTNLFRSYLTVSFIYLFPNSYGPSLWAYLGQVDQNKWAEFHFNWDWVEFGPNSNQPWFCC